MWVRGLKPNHQKQKCNVVASHPMWVRGLKLILREVHGDYAVSHPMWVRGLKLAYQKIVNDHYKVAPHVGAWIETYVVGNYDLYTRSHPMWVRGLKPNCVKPKRLWRKSHPMWVRGLKPTDKPSVPIVKKGRTPCGCVD